MNPFCTHSFKTAWSMIDSIHIISDRPYYYEYIYSNMVCREQCMNNGGTRQDFVCMKNLKIMIFMQYSPCSSWGGSISSSHCPPSCAHKNPQLNRRTSNSPTELITNQTGLEPSLSPLHPSIPPSSPTTHSKDWESGAKSSTVFSTDLIEYFCKLHYYLHAL